MSPSTTALQGQAFTLTCLLPAPPHPTQQPLGAETSLQSVSWDLRRPTTVNPTAHAAAGQGAAGYMDMPLGQGHSVRPCRTQRLFRRDPPSLPGHSVRSEPRALRTFRPINEAPGRDPSGP